MTVANAGVKAEQEQIKKAQKAAKIKKRR